MGRVLFVTGSAGGVGLGNLQHWCALRKSNGGTRNVVNSSQMRAATMPPPSDRLINDFLGNRPGAIPDENNITVQAIPEKSQSTSSAFQRTEARP